MASLPTTDTPRAPLWAAIAWAVCAACLLWLYSPAFATMGFRDPDDAMRLVQVRDWIGGQAFWDISQHRVNPPHGGPMHWSRIIDVPVAGIILLLRPLIGTSAAELAACIMVPLSLLAVLVAGIFVAARRMGGDWLALLVVAMLLTSASILMQFTPLRIDHHGWQICMAAIALCGAIDVRPLRGGVVAALAIAVWLQISSEALPYAALFGAVFAMRYWADRGDAPRFVAYAALLGGAALPLLVALRGPAAAMARQCDALSYVYVWPLVALAIATPVAARLIRSDTAPRRAAITAIGAGAALVTFLLTGGTCLSGDPFQALGPLSYRLWYEQIMEGRPIWEQTLPMIGAIILPTILGILSTIGAARSTRDAERTRWLVVLALLIGASGVSILVMRALSVAHLFALPGIAWLILKLFKHIQASSLVLLRVLGSVSLVLLTPSGLSAAWVGAVTAGSRSEPNANGKCFAPHMLDPLKRLPPATLFASLDIGPNILAFTHHRIIGTGHHRNVQGINAVIEGFVDAPDDAQAIVRRTGATYVVTCDGLNENRLYGLENPKGLAAMLNKRETPDWLQPIPVTPPLKLYRVR